MRKRKQPVKNDDCPSSVAKKRCYSTGDEEPDGSFFLAKGKPTVRSNGIWFRCSFFLFVLPMLVWGGCMEQDRTIEITAQEFRFVPSFLEVIEGQRLRFILRNQGNEPHTFHAPLFLASAHRVQWLSEPPSLQAGKAIVLHPGETVKFSLEPQAGVYVFRCWIKGHAGMEGVIVVKARGQ